MAIYCIKAALFGSIAGILAVILWGGILYGDFTILILVPVFWTFFLFSSLLLAYPLMKLKVYLPEPLYFLTFLGTGFVGGNVVLLLFSPRDLGSINSFPSWETYGSLGAVIALTAWYYVTKTEAGTESE
jgi:hypothetical protein